MILIIFSWSGITIVFDFLPSFLSAKHFCTMSFYPIFKNVFIKLFILTWTNLVFCFCFFVSHFLINTKSFKISWIINNKYVDFKAVEALVDTAMHIFSVTVTSYLAGPGAQGGLWYQPFFYEVPKVVLNPVVFLSFAWNYASASAKSSNPFLLDFYRLADFYFFVLTRLVLLFVIRFFPLL